MSRGWPSTAHLVLTGGKAHLRERGREQASSDGLEFHDPPELAAAVSQLLQGSRASRGSLRLIIEIGPPLLQLRRITGVPKVGARELRAVVSQGASRFFRQNGHRLITDATWLPVPRTAAPLVMGVAIEAQWIEAVLEGAAAAGASIVAVRPLPREGATLSLLPPDLAMARARRGRMWLQRAGWTAAWLWSAVGGLCVIHAVQQRRSADRELAALSAPLEALLAARRKMDEAAGMLGVLDQADADRDRIAVTLTQVGLALPDSSVIEELRLTRRGGLVTGLAAHPQLVVSALERADTRLQPRLESAAVPVAGSATGWIRYVIRLGAQSADGS